MSIANYADNPLADSGSGVNDPQPGTQDQVSATNDLAGNFRISGRVQQFDSTNTVDFLLQFGVVDIQRGNADRVRNSLMQTSGVNVEQNQAI